MKKDIPAQWRHRLFIAYVICMVLLFLTPTPDLGLEELSHIDKVVHLGLFFGFALLFYLDRSMSPPRIFLISTLFAGTIELIQWLLPFRDLEWGDFLASAGGAALASLLVIPVERRRLAARADAKWSGL